MKDRMQVVHSNSVSSLKPPILFVCEGFNQISVTNSRGQTSMEQFSALLSGFFASMPFDAHDLLMP